MSNRNTRNGPTVILRIERTCDGCKHVESHSYRVQGDSGTDVFCRNPDALDGLKDRYGEPLQRRHVGDTSWRTPSWCPFPDLEVRR